MTTAQALTFHVSFIVFVSSFASASRGLERISAVVGPSNSSGFGLTRIRELSEQVTEAGHYAFDIVVLDENTSPSMQDDSPLNGRSRIVTVQDENQIIKWLSRNKPEMILCFSQDVGLPYHIVTARRKGKLFSDVKILSVLEDVMNFQQKDEGSMNKIANVLLLSDLIVFTTARDQTFLENELHNHKLDVHNGRLLKKVQSAVVLQHSSLIKELVVASKQIRAIGVGTDWIKHERIRRNIQIQNEPVNSNVSTTVSPTNATQPPTSSVSTTVSPTTNATQPPTSSVSTTVSPTTNATQPPTSSVSTTVFPANATQPPTSNVSTTISPTNTTQQPTLNVSTTVSPTNTTQQPTLNVSTTVSPTNTTQPPTSNVSTTVSPTNATQPPTSNISTTISPTNTTQPPTSNVSTTVSPTNATQPTTSNVSTTVSPTNSTQPPTSIVSTTVSPTNATQPPTSNVSTTVSPTNATQPPTTNVSTTISTSVTSPRPTTSSTTAFPFSKDDERYIITLEGNCNEVLRYNSRKIKFKKKFKNVIAGIINIPVRDIHIEELKCGSIKVTFVVKNATNINATKILEKAASDGKIVVPFDGKNYTSSGLVVIPVPTSSPPKTTPTPSKKFALYLYIAFGSVMGLVFLIGLIVLIVRCRRDRTSGTFILGNDTDVELKRFRGIPRASYYRVEMYGEPVEVDAARPGVCDDEYDGDIVPYAQTTFNSNSAGHSSSNNNPNKDEFTMGNLPEWNVPKLKTSDIVVRSSGAEQDEDDEEHGGNHNDEALHAYDNPVMTFGDLSNNSSE
ncbi:mental retardation GTPase activating protein homolog 2-like isoform X2 [Actinia tenebrosa]|uniref:Mental retardation GTPase activating protein homolog 2-like isoform X1 n=1 Tax=Actinia tenebrosa TaxID=6105 RepID=A0A6P8HX43_ACTTE|nr:mental retardation GTPase activating protein homolog 2-like isoform X1 [Actinia tenebrosa]XP_031559887.1 mental retardation GTPase activating protein homolog 2-like isoform X2 [Actinia tenebrosa]